MTSRTAFVNVSSIGATAPSTKWCKPPALENRTSSRGAKELLVDYRDFLRVRDLRLWEKDSKEARFVRKLGRGPQVTYETYREFCETRPAEVVANIAICLVHQANYLLDQQIRRLEQEFVKGGGIRERMTQARLQYRIKKK